MIIQHFFHLYCTSNMYFEMLLFAVSTKGHVLQSNIEVLTCNHCCSGKEIGITYSECVFLALCIQYAMRMPSSVACPALQYFFTLSYKGRDFQKSY